MKYVLTRDVRISECPWLSFPMRKGATVYAYYGYTYGCITHGGVAVSLVEGETPFFQLPREALAESRKAKSWTVELNGECYVGKTAKKAWKRAKAFAPEWAAQRQADFNRAYKYMKKWKNCGEFIRWDCHVNLYRAFE